MPGRPPMSDEARKARADKNPQRKIGAVVDFPLTTEPPKPPTWLHRIGKQMWREFIPQLHMQRVLTTADLNSFAHLCQLHGEAVELYKNKLRPAATDFAQMRLLFCEFGMTPASRTRVRASGDEKDGNRFKRNGREPDAKRTSAG